MTDLIYREFIVLLIALKSCLKLMNVPGVEYQDEFITI